MFRFRVAMLAGLFLSAPVCAEGLDGLFSEPNRDFGTVPQGSMLSHPFRLTNNTNTPIKVNHLRVSCGCTVATMPVAEVKPGESTIVTAQMDTRRFVGPKTVQIYVQLEQPAWQEVRLSVTANARTDVTVHPDAIAFCKVPRGSTGTKAATVSFLGNQGIQITGASCESTFIKPEVRAVKQDFNETVYEVRATVNGGLPVGNWFADVWLTTNQAGMPRVRVPVTVEVEPLITANPGAVQMGEAAVGKPTEKSIILRSSKPFKILDVKGTDEQLSVKKDNDMGDAKDVHVLTFVYKPSAAGNLHRTVKVVTDLQNDGVVELPAFAKVK